MLPALQPLAWFHLLLLLTAALLLALLTLGLGLQLRLWQTARLWHHALYFAVVVGVTAALALAWWAGAGWPWLLLPLAALLLMPLTKPGRRHHWALALACAAAFGVSVWQVW